MLRGLGATLAENATVALQAGAPFSASPESGATLTPTTTFSWTAPFGGLVGLEVRDDTSEVRASYYTTKSSLPWPGSGLPSGKYEWRVAAYRDVPNADAWATRPYSTDYSSFVRTPWREIVVP